MHNADVTQLNNLAFEAAQTVQKMNTVLGMWQNEFTEKDSGSKAETLVSLLLDLANNALTITQDIERATAGEHSHE